MLTDKIKLNYGFGLLEIVIASAIISIFVFSFIGVFQNALRVSGDSTKEIQASFLIEEGLEAVRIMRDSGWQANIAPLAPATDYYFEFANSTWQATSSNIYIDGLFERKFILNDVYRDGNDDIAVSGTFDPNTKQVSSFVSWLGRGGTTTRTVSTYMTNLFSN